MRVTSFLFFPFFNICCVAYIFFFLICESGIFSLVFLFYLIYLQFHPFKPNGLMTMKIIRDDVDKTSFPCCICESAQIPAPLFIRYSYLHDIRE